jgi:hypothetical protein
MATDARMTVRLDSAMRRKVERCAARKGISLNEALNWLLQRAPDESEQPTRPHYRLKPRKVGFGFDIARARSLASETADEQTLRKLKARR